MSQRLLVRGGMVVDGTGRPARPADVLIEGDTIVTVGDPAHPGIDAAVIEAAGAVVAPGFIDLHTHADHSILAFPTADSALRQGVTTIAVGNCGGGVAPISPDHDVRPVAFASRPEWGEPTWATFPEYIDHLAGVGVNVAAMVPHGALRNAVIGIDPRPATDDEIAVMRGLLAEALAAGAVGMSTGLQYRPGCWATEAEIRALVETVGERGGIYATHMRDRSEHYVAAIDEALRATAGTGAHLQLSHVVARPNATADEIDRAIERMVKAADGRFGVDTFPEPWGPGLLVDLFPTELMDGDTTQVLARLADPTTRRAMEDHIDAESSFLARIAGNGEIFLSWVPDRPDLAGISLGSAGERVGAFCCDVLLGAGERLREVGIRHVYADDAPLSAVIALPFCSVASDGIVTSGEDDSCPLPWSASTYGFTARLLETYVRDRRLLTVEEAVRRLTSLPATALGLSDRGVLATGKRADLVIFDPDRIHDRSGPTAMARHPLGIAGVVVNGVVAVDPEGLTGTRAGRVLRNRPT